MYTPPHEVEAARVRGEQNLRTAYGAFCRI
jgi:hypothetical protein